MSGQSVDLATTTTIPEIPGSPATPAAANAGRWVAGQSGNPKGRPKGTLLSMQRDLEGAIRDHLTADKVRKIVDKIVDRACNGDVKAAKLILDKLVPNATDAPDAGESGRTIVFRIENATFAATPRHTQDAIPPPIEGEVTVIQQETNG